MPRIFRINKMRLIRIILFSDLLTNVFKGQTLIVDYLHRKTFSKVINGNYKRPLQYNVTYHLLYQVLRSFSNYSTKLINYEVNFLLLVEQCVVMWF